MAGVCLTPDLPRCLAQVPHMGANMRSVAGKRIWGDFDRVTGPEKQEHGNVLGSLLYSCCV